MNPGPNNLTLEEIGRIAGVSRSTVSRVLNDHPHVRPEIRTLVQNTIRDTGYLPNQAARALVSKRTGLIGLVMPTDSDELFGDPYYSALVHGIQEGCLAHGTAFSIFPVYGASGETTVLSALVAQGFVDGVVITAGPRSDHLISRLRDRKKPMVVVGHPENSHGLRRVDVENRAGSASAVEHLVGLGRERIGYIGPTLDYLYGAERYDGYCASLKAAGRPVDETIVSLTSPTPAAGYDAALRIPDGAVDALHVATDPMALGVLRAFAERGIAVPDQIAIVGFDGLPGAPTTSPALTTVVQPVARVGKTAVDMLVADEVEDDLFVLPTTLRVRESCGAPH